VSQAAGAAAGWLAALDPLADEMDPLAVLSWDMQVPKLTERPPTRPLSMLDRAPADGPWCAGSSLRLRSPIVTAPKDVDHSTSKAMRCPKARCLIDEDLVTNQRVPRAGGRFRLKDYLPRKGSPGNAWLHASAGAQLYPTTHKYDGELVRTGPSAIT